MRIVFTLMREEDVCMVSIWMRETELILLREENDLNYNPVTVLYRFFTDSNQSSSTKLNCNLNPSA